MFFKIVFVPHFIYSLNCFVIFSVKLISLHDGLNAASKIHFLCLTEKRKEYLLQKIQKASIKKTLM